MSNQNHMPMAKHLSQPTHPSLSPGSDPMPDFCVGKHTVEGGGSRKRGGEGRGVKKKLKAKHVKPKPHVDGKTSLTTHTPLTFPGSDPMPDFWVGKHVRVGREGGQGRGGGKGGGSKKKLKAKHVKPKQNVHGKISLSTHTPLTFPGK